MNYITVGGQEEEHQIEIDLSDGEFIDVFYDEKNGSISLKEVGKHRNEKDLTIYKPSGVWYSAIIELKGNFKNFKEINLTMLNTNPKEETKIYYKTSNQQNKWEDEWELVENGEIIKSSPKKFIRLKIELFSAMAIKKAKIDSSEFDEHESIEVKTLDTKIENKVITLKEIYTEKENILQETKEEDYFYIIKSIKSSDWEKIDKISFSDTSKSLEDGAGVKLNLKKSKNSPILSADNYSAKMPKGETIIGTNFTIDKSEEGVFYLEVNVINHGIAPYVGLYDGDNDSIFEYSYLPYRNDEAKVVTTNYPFTHDLNFRTGEVIGIEIDSSKKKVDFIFDNKVKLSKNFKFENIGFLMGCGSSGGSGYNTELYVNLGQKPFKYRDNDLVSAYGKEKEFFYFVYHDNKFKRVVNEFGDWEDVSLGSPPSKAISAPFLKESNESLKRSVRDLKPVNLKEEERFLYSTINLKKIIDIKNIKLQKEES